MPNTLKITPTLVQLQVRREEIITLAEKYGASNLRVFGSVARGDARPDSDIDFLVDFQEWASLYELSGLWQDLQELLGYEVNVVSNRGLKERFRQRIEPDLVIL